MPPLKYRIDCEKYVVVSNCERRGWQRTSGSDWHIYWASAVVVQRMFTSGPRLRPSDNQLVNHFPTHYELTRKDLIIRNVRKYKRDLEAKNSVFCKPDPETGEAYIDFLPLTYLLPSESSMFSEELKGKKKIPYILKPAGSSQGKGIEIINRPAQFKRWMSTQGSSRSIYLASRYIDRPLLIGNRKFDIRLYVLVVSYTPLKAYIYQNAFCRFCTVEYSSDPDDISDPFVHLTNVAIQKHGEAYSSRHGGKWDISNLKLYISGHYGYEATNKCFERLMFALIHSLKAVQSSMAFSRSSFECYGYDILIDERLHPWLLEVNASPSLTCSTDADRLMKCKLINDIFKIVVPSDLLEGGGGANRRAVNVEDPEDMGDFDVLIDEFKNPRASEEGWMYCPK
ncbi:Tubulin tyrosine ligase [Giardia muris]|uniref:Tubulin tyrosine ligase n=1 Tax=Giardia muris TaxID=5742 RepID=A0A4Z1SWE4_GIAMU|nr:Tubulin tyrosine ligase [Giardia muris]|eukprot:TNJ30142.1 Tubulin tyrosine ligase [Giardia muris]